MAARSSAGLAHPRGHHLPVQHPDHLGLRGLRRLQLPPPGPQRQLSVDGWSEPAARSRRRHASGPSSGTSSPSFPPISPAEGRARPREGAEARRSVNEVFQTLADLPGRHATSTTSTGSGASGRVYVQAESEYRGPPRTSASSGSAADDGDMVPLATLSRSRAGGHELTDRFNLLALGGDQRHLRAAATPPARPSTRWKRCKETMPRGDGVRLVRALLPGEDGPPAGPLFALAIVVRLPAPGRHVRELVAALAVLLGLPLVRPRRPRRRLAPRLRQQRLRPDRLHHAHRPGRQERDPDRRVREAPSTRRAWHPPRPPWSRRGCASGRS